MFLTLISQELGSSQSQTGCDNTFNAVRKQVANKLVSMQVKLSKKIIRKLVTGNTIGWTITVVPK